MVLRGVRAVWGLGVAGLVALLSGCLVDGAAGRQLPWEALPAWAAEKAVGVGLRVNLSESLVAAQTGVRQCWAEACVGVAWPRERVEGGTRWVGSRGVAWVVVRGGWEVGAEIIASKVSVPFFDGLAGRCRSCRIVEQWRGLVTSNTSYVHWKWEPAPRGWVLEDAWSGDDGGLADVAFRAAPAKNEEVIGLRLPFPRFAGERVFAAAWVEVEDWVLQEGWAVERAVLPQVGRWLGPHRDGLGVVRLVVMVGSGEWSGGSVDDGLLDGEEAVQVSCGGHHTCVVTFAGGLRCWGRSEFGQLGYGNVESIGDDESPASVGLVDVGGLVVLVRAGYDSTCALLVGGSVRCWGNGEYGKLGYGNTDTIGVEETPDAVGDVDVGAEVVDIAVGRFSTCVLLVGGKVKCWGSGASGKLGYGNTDTIGDDEAPSSVGVVNVGTLEVLQVVVASYHACVLRDGGSVLCWGSGLYGRSGKMMIQSIGNDEDPVDAGPVQVGAPVFSLSASHSQTCALLNTGALRCWGHGINGALGYGNALNVGDDEAPESAGDVDTAGEVLLVSNGHFHTCAMLVRGKLRCWGNNNEGQLGTGNPFPVGISGPPSSIPPIDLGASATSVSSGQYHSCALVVGGALRCWGSGEYGQLGLDSTQDLGKHETVASQWEFPYAFRPTATGIFGNPLWRPRSQTCKRHTSLASVSVSRFVCVTTCEGKVHCFGDGAHGALGQNTTDDIGASNIPSDFPPVDVGADVMQTAAGMQHVCVVIRGGSVKCWGSGSSGRLGYGNTDDIGDDEYPSAVGSVDVGGEVVQVGTGRFHTCALLREGTVRCWGNGGGGRLGYANTGQIGSFPFTVPALIGDVDVGGTVVSIALGAYHTCALLTMGNVRCWGQGTFGVLGYGNTDSIGDTEHPASAGDVEIGGFVVALGGGVWFNCALLSNASVRCWGRGTSGVLGYGNTDNIGDDETPASAGDVNLGEKKPTAISVGAQHTCALMEGGDVKCWGSGFYGELGYGGSDNIGDDETPADVGVVSVGGTVVQVSCGSHVTCALLESSEVKCWGHGANGALGLGNGDAIGVADVPSDFDAISIGEPIVSNTLVLQSASNAGVQFTPLHSSYALLVLPKSYTVDYTISTIDLPLFTSPFVISTPVAIDAPVSLSQSLNLLAMCPLNSVSNLGQRAACVATLPEGSQLAAGTKVRRVEVEKVASEKLEPIGSSTLTLSDTDFSVLFASGATSDILVGNRSCTNLFISDSLTSLSCVAPPGIGHSVPIEVLPLHHQIAPSFHTETSYLPPVLSGVNPPFNVPVLGSTTLTISGSNFGAPQVHTTTSAFATVDSLPCISVQVVSNFLLTCDAPSGVGIARKVVVVLGNQSSNTLPISSTLPSITSITPSFALLNTTTNLTIEGSDLALTPRDVTSIYFGGVSCVNPSILTPAISLQCELDTRGVVEWPERAAARISIATQSAQARFDLFAGLVMPEITTAIPLSTPATSGGWTLRLLTSSLGSPDAVRGVWVDGEVLLTFADKLLWKSASELQVEMIPGVGSRNLVLETSSGLKSEPVSVSYIAPVVEFIEPSYALLGLKSRIVLNGTGLAVSEDDDIEIVIGGFSCSNPTVILMGESLSCVVDATSAVIWPDQRAISLRIASQATGRIVGLFDGVPTPSISTVTASSFPTNGGTLVRVLADGLGHSKDDVIVEFGGDRVSFSWVSELEVQMSLPSGAGSVPLRLCSPSYLCSTPTYIQYNTPSLTSSSPSYLLTGTTYETVMVCGENLGPAGTNTTIVIGGIPCATSTAINTSCALCHNLPAHSSPFSSSSVVITVANLQSPPITTILQVSNAPSITSISPALISGGDTLTIAGEGFGQVEGDVSEVQVGSATCVNIVLLSPNTLISCTIPTNHPDLRSSSTTTLNVRVLNRYGVASSAKSVGVFGRAAVEKPRYSPVAVWGWREAGVFERVHVAWLYPSIDSVDDERDIAVSFLINAIPLSTDTTSTSKLIDADQALGIGTSLSTKAPSTLTRYSTNIAVSLHTPYNLSVEAVNAQGGASIASFSFIPVPESCSADSFLYTPTLTASYCLPCPSGARCDAFSNSSTVQREAGVYRLSPEWFPYGLGFVSCPQPLACLPDENQLPDASAESFGRTFQGPSIWNNNTLLSIPPQSTSQCREGHEGLLCSQCSLGYFRDPAGLCAVCPSQASVAVGVVGLVLVTFVVVGAFLARTLSQDLSSGSGNKNTAALKIVYHQTQRLAIVGTVVAIEWPGALQNFFTGADSISMFGTGGLAFMECALGEDAHNLVLKTSLTAIILPLALIIFAAFLWWAWPHCCAPLVQRFSRRREELWRTASSRSISTGPQTLKDKARRSSIAMSDRYEEWRNWRNRFQVSAVAISILIHATLVRSSLLTIACFPVIPLSIPASLSTTDISYQTSRLIADPTISCSSSTYSSLLTLGTLTLVIGGLGIPLALFYATFSNRHRLQEVSFRKKWGFAVDAYRAQAYLWESVVLLVKMALVVVVVLFMQDGAVAQLSAGMVVEVLALMLHAWFKPFKSDIMNQLENAGHMATAFTLALCMNLVQGTANAVLVTVFIIAVNVLYLLLVFFLINDPIRKRLETIITSTCASQSPPPKPLNPYATTSPISSSPLSPSPPPPPPPTSGVLSMARRLSLARGSKRWRRASLRTQAATSSPISLRSPSSQFQDTNPLAKIDE